MRPVRGGRVEHVPNGRYTERGIKRLHGDGAGQWRVEAGFAVRVDPRLGLLGVLLEPASVVAKAWDHIERILAQAPVSPTRALVTGAGPIGLLGALLAMQRGFDVHVLDRVTDGPKPELVAALGASYHSGAVADVPVPDIVLECTGAPSVVLDVIEHNASAGVLWLTGVSSGGRELPVDAGAVNRRLVLQNDVVFGSVNANRSHYDEAAKALSAADPAWLSGLITRRVSLASWVDGLQHQPNDVKVVVDLR